MRAILPFASLLLILGCGRLTSPAEPLNRCVSPAPLLTFPNHVAGEYLALFRAGTDPQPEAMRLAAKYGFQLTHVYGAPVPSFAGAGISGNTLAGLRCEATILRVEENAIYTTSSTG